MKHRITSIFFAICFFLSGWSCANDTSDVETLRSNYSFNETILRLQKELEKENVHVFSIIDHASEAGKAELNLRPTVVLIVGNPQVGTALMQENQQSAIELPLKILIAENEQKEVQVSYQKIEPFIVRYTLKKNSNVVKNIDTKMQEIIQQAVL